jgi:hypothetical protein
MYTTWGRDSSVGIGTRLRAERPEFDSRQGQQIFLFSIASKEALGPNQPPIKWVPGLKRQGRKANHPSPYSAQVKNGGAIPPLLRMPSWHSA